MSYLLLIIYLLLLSFIIHKSGFFKAEGLSNWVIIGLFYLKLLSGLALYFTYTHYYNTRSAADIFKYFDDGNIIYSALGQNPWDYFRMLTGIGANSEHLMQYYDTCIFWLKDFNYGLINDNRTVIRFNALVRLISMGNIHIHSLFMNFLSFTGLWAIFKIFSATKKLNTYALLACVFLFPSLLFWGSGVLKEGLLLFGFGVLFYSFNKGLNKGFRIKHILFVALSIGLLMLLKFYVLLAALPGLMLLLTTHFYRKKTGLQFMLVHALFLLLALTTPYYSSFNFIEILVNKQNDFLNYAQSLNQVGSLVHMEPLQANLWSFIKATPQALFNSIFRPTVLDVSNAPMLMAALENLIIAGLLVLGIVFFSNRELKNPLLLFSISFVLILFTLIGLTTPVLGALVRYKIPALPFLGIAILYLINNSKIMHKIPLLKKHYNE